MLLGRDADLAALRAHLAASRLVTVTGVGGVGKTALALAVAAEGSGRTAVCELAAVTRAEDVAVAVGEALGFPSLDAAVVGLSGVRMLVVLDNAEHVLDAAADAARRLLATSPGISVLATSREPLELPGERVVPLSPLALPDDDDPEHLRDSPAAALLLSRARDAGSDVTLDIDSAPAVAALCRRLDGLPLALELAAARTRSLTPAEILTHLDERLDLLSRSRDRGPSRHRSLETAIAWSYARLPGPTARFFDRLGVFDGRFTAQEARAVAGAPGADVLEVVEQLDHLVSRSMLTVRQQADRSWYGLLDTLRAFARARLAERGELEAVRDRRVDRLVEPAGATRWDEALSGGPDAAPLGPHGLGTPTDVLNAVRWCLDRDDGPARAVVLVRQLVRVVYRARPEPVAELGEALLERWRDRRVPAWAEFAAVTAFAHMAVRSTDRAAEVAGAALSADPSPFAEVLALRTLSFHEVVAGRPERALAWTDRAVAAADTRGAPAWASEMRTYRASALVALGRFGDAARQADEAHAQAVAAGGGFPEVLAALIRANLLVPTEPALARKLLLGVAQRSRDGGHPLVEGPCSWSLARIALRDDGPAQAADRLAAALELFVRIGHTLPLRVTLRWVAVLVGTAGRAEAAAALRAAAGDAHTLTLYEWPWSDLVAEEPTEGDVVAPPLREAVALARRELDALRGPAAPETADVPPEGDATPPRGPNRFRLDGAVWTVSYAGQTVRLPDAKGMHDLAALLARPGREVHSTELIGAAVEQPAGGEVLDARARRDYEARIRRLQDDLDEAEHAGDRGRAEAARLELDLLVDQLTAATGLHGRARRPGGTGERARSAVTWRIRAALRRLEEVHPQLGRHLRSAVRTGTWCCYAPEDDVAWRVG
ncbi:ATP-binding protein [Actinomycetospora lemnae]|uniref:ATPase n=1 Tax=Actinomycetospora lemnae TaxID=3019891 RepID=A0ABT5SQ66_9PSEU|nr:hypothetical protein [Actinomycetospora sp. DW7H6]MDD7964806.1 hypothetical protein [Actinomycetospora sp. DW7H6]